MMPDRKWAQFNAVLNDDMPRSMAPTLAKLDRLAQSKIDTERLTTSYQRGRQDGIKEGRAEAFATLRWAAIPLLLIGYLTACAVRLM
jgi:hypothetical protein